MIYALGLLVGLNATQAAEHPDRKAGLITTGVSAGGELAGALAGGAAGLGIGALTCSASRKECWGPTIGASVGAIAGAGAGAIGGSALGAKWAGRRPGRAALWSGLTLGGGIGVMLIGNGTNVWTLSAIGLGCAVAGPPIAGGLAAATDHDVSVALDYAPPREAGQSFERVGLRMSVVF